MEYWFLYKLVDGVIYNQPYLGSTDQWTNIPAGCGILGPIPQSDATAADAFQNPTHYNVQGGKLVQVGNISNLQLTSAIASKLSELTAACQQSLQTFTSNALGALRTYLSRTVQPENDWALFNGEFAFVTGAYYDNNPILWYTEETGNVNHTKAQFIQVYLNARLAVAMRKKQLSDLQAQVQAYANSTTPATDLPKVQAIVWSDPWAAAPAAPAGLTGAAGAAGSGQATLNWTANSDPTMQNGGGYNVYVDGVAAAKNATLVTANTFTVTGLAVGAHTFQITALGANGIESAKCTSITVIVS